MLFRPLGRKPRRPDAAAVKGIGIWFGLAFGLLIAAALLCVRWWAMSRRW